jgi:hypothetical protein
MTYEQLMIDLERASTRFANAIDAITLELMTERLESELTLSQSELDECNATTFELCERV